MSESPTASTLWRAPIGSRDMRAVSKNALTSYSVQMYNLGCGTDAELPREKPACDRSSKANKSPEKQPKADAGLHQAACGGRAARRGTEPSAGSQIRPHLA